MDQEKFEQYSESTKRSITTVYYTGLAVFVLILCAIGYVCGRIFIFVFGP